MEVVRICMKPGRFYVHGSSGWESRSSTRTLCGTLVRVTSLKMGDARLMQDVAIMRVKRMEIAAPSFSASTGNRSGGDL